MEGWRCTQLGTEEQAPWLEKLGHGETQVRVGVAGHWIGGLFWGFPGGAKAWGFLHVQGAGLSPVSS